MFSIPLTLISSPIVDMLTKLIPTLLVCHRRYERNQVVCGEIRQLFITFLDHFNHCDVSLYSNNVQLQKRFETLKLIKEAIE